MWCFIFVLIIFAAIPFTISSNETSPEHQIFSGSRERRQIVVPLSTKQKPCVLLPHPEHGLYQVTNVPDASPGDSFDSLELRVTCRRGYGFLESGGNGILKLYCVNGIWSQGIPKCVRFCKLDPDPSVRYMCQVLGVGYRICDRYVSPGTTVDPVCNSPIYSSPETLSYMKCIAGFWDYVAKCKPECGRVTPKGEQLVIGGERAKRGELPWHTGIYKKTSTPYMQICGGSLVSNNVVISAAHCFWTDVQMQLPASKFAAAVGKLYRPWNNERDLDVQKSDVKEILLPPLFYGSSANFQEDIAVVVLVTPVVYKTFVRPVCLNFDLNFDRWQLQDGKLGKVAGWGLFAPNGKASQVLQVVQLPYINLKTCVNTVPLSFREFITADKFCAGYTNGTALCKGDSGGGLAFSAYTELDIERYYLRGVVSAAPSSDDLCNANTYTAFTKITRHEEFIKQSIASADKLCPPYLFQCDDGTCVDQGADCDGKQDCADGSDEANELCIPSFESSNTSLGLACILPTINNGRAEPSKPNSGQFLEAVVLVTCKEGYDLVDSEGLVSGNSLQMSCRNGTWDQNVPNCTLKTDCGQVFDSKPLVLGDRTARRGELPWHAAIYSNNKDPYEHICGGNIISRYAVLSAAHCYRNGQPPSSYAVASGKMNGPWDHEDDVEVQRSDVKEIKISNLYNQKDAKDFKADLAVLILEKQITFTSYIKPVCLNFDNFEKEEMTNGILARVAAWSFTSKKSSHLQILKAVDMTYLSLKICNNTLAEGLAKFNTVDKVCAGYAKDRRVFRSLAGSGIVLPRVQSAVTQYYLQGVLAYVVPCLHCVETSDAYYMFTSVFQNKDFIKQFI